jgi:NAD(P)H-dependent FMN reductase
MECPVMPTVIAISGSLRAASFNTALLRAAQQLKPDGMELEIASIADIPLYNGDVEAATGIPTAVADLKERIATSAGLLIATPEYNNSIPGVLKNAIDWLTRPGSDIPRVFGKRPVALMGATPGRGGTLLSQAAWLPVFRTLGVRPWFGPRLIVSGAAKLMDERGELIDEPTRAQLQKFMAGFAGFIAGEP